MFLPHLHIGSDLILSVWFYRGTFGIGQRCSLNFSNVRAGYPLENCTEVRCTSMF